MFQATTLVGHIQALSVDPLTSSIVYAGTLRQGVRKSINGGATWSFENDGLPLDLVFTTRIEEIIAIAIDPITPSTLYVGTSQGAFESTNGGGNWSLVLPFWVWTFAIDPATPSTLYAGTAGNFILKRTTGTGLVWNTAASGLTAANYRSLVIDPATPSTLYAGTESGVFKSMNGGASWSFMSSSPPTPEGGHAFIHALAIDPATPSTLYAGTANLGVFKSTDGGESWNSMSQGLPEQIDIYALAIHPTNPATVYAGTESGVFHIRQLSVSIIPGSVRGESSPRDPVPLKPSTIIVAPPPPTLQLRPGRIIVSPR